MEHLKYRADIDGLRAVAVLSVVIFHYFPSILPGGFVGVDIFFVISGYLITSIILKSASSNSFSYVEFYKRRILRIFPALSIVLISCLIIGWIYFFQDDYKSLGKHVFSGAFFISNLTLWSESGYFDSQSYLKPLLHLWSLGIEEQFYILWPIVILCCFKSKHSKRNILLSCAAIFIVSYTISVSTMAYEGGANYYSPASRFWELMAGAIIATLRFMGIKTSVSKSMSLLGVIIITLSIALINENMAFPGYIAIIPVIGASLIIASNGNDWFASKALSFKPIVFIGLISYPLYLWHWPVYSFYRSILSGSPSTNELLILMALALVLAILTYFLLEKPLRHSRKKSITTIILAVVVFGSGVFGIVAYSMNGIKERSVNKSAGEYASVTNVYDYYKYGELLRGGICHSVLLKDAISNGCIKNSRNNIFIIGDSYAAALYNGLSSYIKNNNGKYVISQMTDGNAPPLFVSGKDDLQRNVGSINADRIKEIGIVKPEIVLLTWSVRGSNGVHDKKLAIEALSLTIKEIKKVSPQSRLIVVGPVPEWNANLVKVISNYTSEFKKTPPIYMSYGLNDEIKGWDKYFDENVPKLGVEYISAYRVLCNESGCLTRVGNGPDNLTAVDWGHLTKPGSDFLMNKIGNLIIK
ncbi:acyltransferase [Salmonella enterica]|uniref:Acyltransferase n=1 Tax=Salmonella enterica subsp. enterica serovar Javiana TaxID=363569 RepID=A0A702PKP2_SALET|nr:acyltransferase [Salmonella enterica]EGY7146133.1 acyltransferase [Salmonella enterica subsp. enterica serovar Javiana]EKR1524081.1 acyltransferase [Salmonella enterica subsp. enterica serovar Javiana]HAC6949006.1 acyltransferase [Salmonella enterica subsp. enterica serovar Javiana]